MSTDDPEPAQLDVLRRSEATLRKLQRVAGIGSWEVELESGRMTWSESMFSIFGADPASFAGTYAEYRSRVHAEDAARVQAASAASRSVADGGLLDLEYRIVRPDGAVRTVHEHGEVTFDAAGKPVRAVGVVLDVTERRLTEAELTRTSRALQMLSRCNEAVIRAQDERTLLDEVCRVAVDVGGYRMASVLFAQDDTARTFRPVAHAGHEANYFAGITLSWAAERADGNGPAGRAMRSARAVMVADLAADPDCAPWAQAALERGYRSVVALPLKSADRPFGVFGLYSGEVRSIAPREVALLHELADDLAFGIAGLRVKAERQLLLETAMAISERASGSIGAAHFEKLLQALLLGLGADAGFIAGLSTEGASQMEAICAVIGGEVVPRFRYAVAATPCEDIRGHEELVIERDVCVAYPRAASLAKLQAQAYVGKNLLDADGERIGTMFILYRKPLAQRTLAVAMLRMFAARVAAEIVRQRDESRLRDQVLLLDQARDAIFVRTLDDRITYWNQGAQRLYGWMASEVLGRSVRDLKVADLPQFLEATQCLQRDGEWFGELEERTKDDRRVVVECRWSLLQGDGGAPLRVLAINTDITERKRTEKRLAESEVRAAHAQRMESIGQLTGGIAHDFNNLLTVIIGNSAELSEELRERPRLAEMAHMVATAGQRAAELTNRLLAFARRQALEPKRIEPPGVIEGMLAMLRRTLGENIEIKAITHPATWPVYIDPGQLELAILNLCINARDAMPEGGKLMIETANLTLDQEYAAADFEVTPGEYVMVAITDTGGGIPPGQLARVFDPFFTTKPSGKGTGLGLSMVYGFTKQSGGSVRIYSEVAVGTTVKLYLPRLRAEAAAARPRGPSPPQPEPRGSAIILLVEDDALVRSHAARLLEDLGYRVIAAADGPEALAIAGGDRRIDLLFTDVMMPGGMNGPQLAEAVGRLRPNIAVLYTSGYTENAVVHHRRVDAGRPLLHKPYDRRALAEKIRHALLGRDILDAAPPRPGEPTG